MTEALQLEIRTLRALLDSERDPGGRAFAPLADAYRRAGRVPEALRVLREGIAKHPEFVTGHVVAAQLYVEQGLSAEGAFAARRALELDGENVCALKSLLRALDESRETQEAESVRTLLTALEPDFAPDWATSSHAATTDDAGDLSSATDELAEEPAIAVVEPEIEKPLATFEGTIDLSTIGPIPSADLPLSALAPEPEPPIEEPFAPLDLATALAEPRAEVAPATSAEPGLDLAFLEAVADEPVMDLATLAPEAGLTASDGAIEDSVFDLATLAPSSTDVVEDEPVMDLAMLAPDDAEPVMDLETLAPDAEDEPVMDLAMLAPDDAEPVMDLETLAPDAEDEPVMDLAMLAPAPIAAETVMDLAMLAPDDEEPVMDLAMLAPEPIAAETVMDLAMLAPDDEEPVMDLAMLAPSSDEVAEDEPVMDLAMLAPDDEEPVMDLAMLAPSSDEVAEDEPVMDLAMLAPSYEGAAATERAPSSPPPSMLIPEDEPVFELDALAPAPVPATPTVGNGQMAVEDAVEIGFLSPDEPEDVVVDLDALRPEPVAAATSPASSSEPAPTAAEAPRPAVETQPAPVAPVRASEAPVDDEAADADLHSDEQGTPIFTRTLAELYAAQGATKEAVQVLRRLLSDNPQDAGLASRIAELEAAAGTTKERAHERKEEEVEALARDLAEGGGGAQDLDSPFAWTDSEVGKSAGVGGPTIRQYFDELLDWEPREGA